MIDKEVEVLQSAKAISGTAGEEEGQAESAGVAAVEFGMCIAK